MKLFSINVFPFKLIKCRKVNVYISLINTHNQHLNVISPTIIVCPHVFVLT